MAGAFIIVAGIAEFVSIGPNHLPYGADSAMSQDIPAVAPYDMTLVSVSMSVVSAGGLLQDASILLRAGGSDTTLISGVAGFTGVAVNTVNIPLAKGDTFELLYDSPGVNSGLAMAAALHFTTDGATDNSKFPLYLKSANVGTGAGEARLYPGEQSPYAKRFYPPVDVDIDRAMYHLSTPATVAQTVDLLVDNLPVAQQVLAVGEQILDFQALGITLTVGQSIYATVLAFAAGDSGAPTMMLSCTVAGAAPGVSEPLLVLESLNPNVPNSFAGGHFAMPFDGLITYAGLTSKVTYSTPETVSISVNGGPPTVLGVVTGSNPILIENYDLQVVFNAGDVLTILNTGDGPTNGSITLTLGFSTGTSPAPPPDDLTEPPSPPGRSTVGPAPIGSYPIGGPFVFDEVVVYNETVIPPGGIGGDPGDVVVGTDSMALFYRIVASEPAPLGECLTVYPDSSSTMVVPADDCIVGGA